MKKVIIGLCCLLFCYSIHVQAAKNTQCTVYSGSNVDKQSYTYNRWSRPVYSYLETQENGGLMRFQANASSDGYLVEYYDKEYNLNGTQLVEKELPLFGAFYATDDNYYLLTGQSNPDESDSVEVYRITKYDKDWKKISSCGLFGANTYIPFDAGSARVTDAGKYLLIRTCHEMYKSSDGYHHQANVTIQVDTQTMKVTDSFTKGANIGVGYVSHSFNQFIKVENNKIVAVDHGDAYPRAIVLVKSNKEITNGIFQGLCTHSELLSIPGSTGDNTTGVTIGGFEISDSAYLVAGTQDLVQGKPSTGCNIYVFTQNKKTGTIEKKKITNYTQETTSGKAAMTPQLVSLGNDQYLLLWSKENVINYVKLDGDGNTISEQYSMQGNLSDCVPVVNGNKVIWYTWSNEKIQFYEINMSDISKNNTVSISNGHQYEYGTVDENCVVTKACTACKKELKVNIPKSFSVYWRKGWNLYVAPSERYDKDSKVLYQTGYTYADVAASNGYEKEAAYIVESSNETVATVDKQEEAVTTKEAGITTLSFYLEYNPTVKKQYILRVGEDGQFDINDCDITLSKTSYEYDGRAHKPGVTVTYQGNTLASGKDYELQYSDNTKVGTGKVTINGLGIFGQSVTKEFAITAGFSDATVEVQNKKLVYNAKAQEPPVTVKLGNEELEENVDYTVCYSDNIEVGTATVTINGMGKYSGIHTSKFEIVKADPDIGEVTYADEEPIYTSTPCEDVLLQRADATVEGTLLLDATEFTEEKTAYAYTFTPKDTKNYNIVTGTITLEVRADELLKIQIIGKMQKRQYMYGDDIDLSGLTVKAYYASGREVDVTEKVIVESPKAGDTQLQISYCNNGVTKSKCVDGITVAKKTIDLSGLYWDTTQSPYIYDGTDKMVRLCGTLPKGVSVAISGNQGKLCGDYVADAVFSLLDSNNYEFAGEDEITAAWRIVEADSGNKGSTGDDDKKTPTGTPSTTELPTNGIKNPNSQTDAKKDATSGNTADDIENIAFPLEEGSQITLANTIYEVVSDDEDAPAVCLLEDQSNMKKISIPATIQWNGIEYQVVEIGDYAFEGNKNLTSVVIGKNIEIIGEAAFMNCKNLKKVSLGTGLNTIEKKAFYNCKKLSKLNIYSRGIRKIGKKAFSKTSGKLTVKIPANKKRIYKKLLRKAGLR